MFNDILNIILKVAEGAFTEITVFVGIALILFGYFNFKNDGNFIKTIQKNKKFQPLIGAFLGLIPGCGGAILIAPLYIKKTVTLGTVVAALIATMGDSSFLLMTKSPKTFILVSIFTFIIGVVSGYIVDYGQFEKRFNLNNHFFNRKKKKNIFKNILCRKQYNFEHIGHKKGDEIDLILHHDIKGHQSVGTIGFKITHKGYVIYFAILIIGLMIGIANLFNFDFGDKNISKIISTIGIIGTFGSIFLMLAGHKYFSEHTHEEEEIRLTSLKETFIHSIIDTAFIGTWVFIAFLLYEMFIYFIGMTDLATGNDIFMQLTESSEYYAIMIGALVGMIPGCGPQIIFVSLYLKGILPIEALIAHSISQDGDALLPLIAMDVKSSLVITIITTIVALIVGYILIII